MELEDSPLYFDVQKILNSKAKDVHFIWTGVIHTPDDNIDIMKITTIDINKNFETNIGDEIMLECTMQLGTYIKRIYPFKGNLEITLTASPSNEISAEQTQSSSRVTRYKALLAVQGMLSGQGTEYDNYTELDLNTLKLLTVNFQLIDRTVEKLRQVTVGGIFREATTEDVARAILSEESKNIKVEGKPAVDKIDIVDTAINIIRTQVVIPQGTKLLYVPTYLQKNCGGIYSTGLGSYLQDKTWFMYPLFNTKRGNAEDRPQLMIYKVPAQRLVHLDRSFNVESNVINILATGELQLKDDGEATLINKGNGYRMADANKFMQGGLNESVDNKTVMKRGSNNDEVLIKPRDDQKNFAPIAASGISINRAEALSAITSRPSGILTMQWQNSDHTLLIPGMIATLNYDDRGEVKQVKCVLLNSQTMIQKTGAGITSTKYSQNTILSFYAGIGI